MKSKLVWTAAVLGMGLLPLQTRADKMSETLPSRSATVSVKNADKNEALVQVALLLDTSGSMKGLVDQARCQLWNVVADLAKARRGGQPIRLEIAVYQYGTETVSKKKGCLRQVVSFTDNLDEVSNGLFSLVVKGGDEYCGQVIGAAVDQLQWSANPSVYKVVFIAGNEPFDQGKTTYGEILPKADAQSIVVNTIYCGSKYAGEDQWKVASKASGGIHAKIDHNHHLPNIKTPLDGKMRELNRKMNETFIWYGDGSDKAAKNQQSQDKNADRMSDHAFAARMSAKIGHLYHHVHHDLVDAYRHGKVDLEKMSPSSMPENLREMSKEERMQYVTRMTEQRQSIRRQMADVIAQRHQFLQTKMSESLNDQQRSAMVLGDALVQAIRKQAREKGYRFGEGVAQVNTP